MLTVPAGVKVDPALGVYDMRTDLDASPGRRDPDGADPGPDRPARPLADTGSAGHDPR